MSNLFLTLVVTFLLIVIAIACLAAGWLISGRKTRVVPRQKTEENLPPPAARDIPERFTPPQEPTQEDTISAERDSNKESGNRT